ncbi:hypothetical protein GE061_006968 [Apolygus lucorum]|uniref:RING-type E3 ubiquitin transferase n=1 Tax=Apolygus lucorum TaxID=248454 RepID=A0A6A4IS14_APOLU|nr:hypothetical protein GE061_006968 [Apolygus lucorum]
MATAEEMTPIIGRRLPFQRTESNGSSTMELEPRFECPICLKCLEKPVQTSCGHRFCAECIQLWLQKNRGCCPIDGRALDPGKDVFPDNALGREIDQQSVVCSYPNCRLVMPLLAYDKHVVEVHEQFEKHEAFLICPFKNIGCLYQFKNPNQLNTHVEKLTHHHLQLLANSFEALSMKVPGSSIHREIDAMSWDPPQKDGTPTTEASMQSLIKSLYERVVTLEQRNTEQDLQLRRMSDKLNQIMQSRSQFEAELGLRVCNGEYTWVVANLENKIRRILMAGARADELSCIIMYSDGFYSSFNGYRFCAKILVNPSQRHLSLHIHLMIGDKDDFLEWPFKGKIAFTLIHPTDALLSVREVMCSRPDVEAFKRPTDVMNKRGFGYPQFMSLADLVTKKYFNHDGSLNIRIQVDVF